MNDTLKLVSYLAPNSFWLFEAIAAQFSHALGLKTQLWQGEHTPLEDPLLYSDEWDLAFICGLPFVLFNRGSVSPLRPLAAPVMQAARYQGRPVYFSDVVVRADRHFETFAELAGKIFCYNDIGSNSGYNLMRCHLKQGNYAPSFFGSAIATGSHQRSIQWVADGSADCAAIDSTVLEQALRDDPALATQIRILDSIGPCPMPPLVAAPHLDEVAIAQLQAALVQPEADLQCAMARAQVQRYAPVSASDYEPIAADYDAALAAGYERLG